MRHSALALFFAFLTIFSFNVPASANGTETGRRFSISLDGLAESTSPGSDLTGTFTITFFGTGTTKPGHYDVYISTPLGDAPVQSGDFRAHGGTSRTIPLSLPVEANAPGGAYTIKIAVTYAGETLSVGHDFVVSPLR